MLLTSPQQVHAVHVANDETLKIGLIGCGGRGLGAATDALEADANCKLVAMADLFEDSLQRGLRGLEKQEKFAGRIDVPKERQFVGFDSYKQLLATDIDVVLLCSPPYYRPDHLEAAVAAGKHIFCEKPVAVDPVGARRVMKVVDQVEASGLNLVSGLCWRYDLGLRETVNRVLDGQIGKIISTQANYLTSPIWVRVRKPNMTDMEYQAWNWYYYVWLSGDHFLEQFVHSLDKAMWLHGDELPVKCYGQGGRETRDDATQGDIYDHFAVVYEWADGTRTFAATRQFRDSFMDTEDYIFGTRGSAELIAHRIKGESPWQYTGPTPSMYLVEHQELFSAIRGNRPRINNGKYMTNSTRMGIMGREACYSGQIITDQEVVNSPQSLGPERLAMDAPPPAALVRQPGQYRFPLPPQQA
jgi:predicted dehydrogenase